MNQLETERPMKIARIALSVTVVLTAGFLACLLFAGCKTSTSNNPPSTTDQVIDCSRDVINKCGPEVLPAVNNCLAGMGDWQACLFSMFGPIECGTESVIDCWVRDRGDAAAQAAITNPDDDLSARKAEHARQWIALRGARFAP